MSISISREEEVVFGLIFWEISRHGNASRNCVPSDDVFSRSCNYDAGTSTKSVVLRGMSSGMRILISRKVEVVFGFISWRISRHGIAP
jgi:hypothetical protein